ncbi:MAG: UDP-2,3-diacylglucosamine diphosphatase LpxI [Verrucomicrobiota bacterium]
MESQKVPQNLKALGLIAGKGRYPALVVQEARRSGVERVTMAAFEGETTLEVAELADEVVWMRVGQLGKLLKTLKEFGVKQAMMAGQITPGRLFELRPDWQALKVLLSLKQRNAETLFGAVADAMERAGIELLPAMTFLDEYVAGAGHLAGPRADRQLQWDLHTAWPVITQLSALDVGQCVVVKKGTILAVEGYDGTNATIRRGGELGRGGATLCKISKPNQDFRFDVPVIGLDTVKTCQEAGIQRIILESGKALILDKEEVFAFCKQHKITLWGNGEK